MQYRITNISYTYTQTQSNIHIELLALKAIEDHSLILRAIYRITYSILGGIAMFISCSEEE